MEIFLITSVDLTVNFAPRTHILELYKCLSKNNNVVLFVMSATKKEIAIVRDLYHSNFIFKKRNIKFMFRFLVHGFVIIAQVLYVILYTHKRPDIVYVRSFPNLVFIVLLCKMLNIPVVSDFKGVFLNEAQLYKKLNYFKRLITNACEKYILAYSKKVIVSQSGIAQYLIYNYNIDNDRIEIIPNGVNTDVFIPMRREEALRKLNLDIKKRYIGFVGSLEKWQGIEYLLYTMKAIRNNHPNVCLLIIGSGSEYQFIAQFIKNNNLINNVLLISSVSYEEVPYYINSCEFCFAYKSKLKTGISALKFYEYLACEKPIIASRVGGTRFIEAYGLGELVEQDSAESLIKVTEKWINKPKEEIKEIGRKGRAFVVQNHSWKLVSDKLERLFSEVLNGKKKVSKNY